MYMYYETIFFSVQGYVYMYVCIGKLYQPVSTLKIGRIDPKFFSDVYKYI